MDSCETQSSISKGELPSPANNDMCLKSEKSDDCDQHVSNEATFHGTTDVKSEPMETMSSAEEGENLTIDPMYFKCEEREISYQPVYIGACTDTHISFTSSDVKSENMAPVGEQVQPPDHEMVFQSDKCHTSNQQICSDSRDSCSSLNIKPEPPELSETDLLNYRGEQVHTTSYYKEFSESGESDASKHEVSDDTRFDILQETSTSSTNLDIKTEAMDHTATESMSSEREQAHSTSYEMLFKDNSHKELYNNAPFDVKQHLNYSSASLYMKTEAMELSETESVVSEGEQVYSSYEMSFNAEISDTSDIQLNANEPLYDMEDKRYMFSNTGEKPEPEKESLSSKGSEQQQHLKTLEQLERYLASNMDKKNAAASAITFSREGNRKMSNEQQSHLGHISLHDKGYNRKESGKVYEIERSLNRDIQSDHCKRVKFTCKKCGNIFKNERVFSAHLDVHDKGYNCQECGRGYTSKGSLRRHMVRDHVNSISLSCKQCGNVFSDLTCLISHLEVHRNGYNCKQCSKEYEDEKSLKNHIVKEHGDYAPASCRLCREILENNQILTAHLDAHQNVHNSDKSGNNDDDLKSQEAPMQQSDVIASFLQGMTSGQQHKEKYNCKECDKSYSHAASLGKHMKTTHIKIAPLSCRQCRKKLINESYLSAHLDVHTKGHNCSKCGRGFSHKRGLRLHMFQFHKVPTKPCSQIKIGRGHASEKEPIINVLQSHRKYAPLSCRQCGKILRNEYYLPGHLDYHKRKYNCTKCVKRFHFEKSLMLHHFKAHYAALSCIQCKSILPNKTFLPAHLNGHKEENRGTKGYLSEKDRTRHRSSYRYEALCCKQCRKELASETLLSEHLEYHRKKISCKKCGKRFELETELKMHLFKDHYEALSCKQCRREFPDDRFLSGHLAYHKREFNCKKCLRECENEKDLEGHMLKVHNVAKRNYKCEHCGKSYLLQRTLKRHINSAHGAQKVGSQRKPRRINVIRFACNKCGRGYRYEKALMTHMLEVHKPDNEVYVCSTCDVEYQTERNLIKHRREGHESYAPLSCRLCREVLHNHRFLSYHLGNHNKKQCRKAYMSEKRLDSHMQAAHTAQKETYDCKKCNDRFVTAEALAKHALVAHCSTCNKCGEVFGDDKLLADHLHSHEKGLSCKHCGRVFRLFKFLKAHILEMHTDESVLKCKYCGRLYSSEDALSKHIDRHEKKNYCDKCDKIFKKKRQLNQHIRIMHNADKLFTCEDCHKNFRLEHVYLDHVEVHKTGFTCSHCPQAYVSESSLDRHKEANHSDK